MILRNQITAPRYNPSPQTQFGILPMLICHKQMLPIILMLCFGMVNFASAVVPEVPGATQTKPIALVGGVIHTVSGKTIEQGTLLFIDGKIFEIGGDVNLPVDVEVIDVKGKHVYPGLIDANSNMGLVEINAVRATVDERETGSFNPNVKAQVAINPDSEIIPTTRSNGVLLCLTAPSGGVVSGQSAVIQLDGWTYEDLTIRSGAGLHINWPLMAAVSDWQLNADEKKTVKARDENMQRLEEFFETARRYDAARRNDPSTKIDVKWESMRDVLAGKIPVIASAEYANQIQAAVAFSVRQKVKLIISGGYDSIHCTDLLKHHDIPVILGGIYRLPRRDDDFYDLPYEIPAILKKAGVRFCIASDGRFGASMVRNLPFHAGTAHAYGLSMDEALRSVTLSTAEILGVADRVGSLEKGKDATLVITNGNILDIRTNVEAAFIQGRRVDLSDRHKKLYYKYEQRIDRAAAQDAK